MKQKCPECDKKHNSYEVARKCFREIDNIHSFWLIAYNYNPKKEVEERFLKEREKYLEMIEYLKTLKG